MAYKVFIPQKINRIGEEYLEDKGYEIIQGSGFDEETMIKEGVDCDAILVRMAKLTKNVINGIPKLKVIGRHGVGVDNVDVAYAESKGIWVTNAPLSNYNAVSEQAAMLILNCAKNSRIIDIHFREGDYKIGHKVISNELKGKTLGIIGLGRIGREVANKLGVGFGMKVICDPHARAENIPSYIEKKDSLLEVFQQADFISIHMPLNDKTKNSIGTREFQEMKATSYLINTARGGIINEGELIIALEQGLIAGYATDFLDDDPPNMNNPLFKFENVIITPHNAAITNEAMDLMGLHAAQGIHEVLSGQKPSWPVNNPF